MAQAAARDAVAAEETHAARRGFFVITGAKVWFLVCGTILNIGLPRLLDDPGQFGDFSVVNTLISIVNMVMIAGALQAVSKRVSEHPERVADVRRAALRMQAVLGLVFFGLLFGGADLLATHALLDPSLAPLIRVASFITLFYAWYAPLIGLLNGLRRFVAQAGFDIFFATVKTALIVGLVLAGFGVIGAFIGFAATAAAATLLAYWLTSRDLPPDTGARVPLGRFMAQVMGYVLASNLLLQGDVLVLKAAAFEPVQAFLRSPEGALQVDLVAGLTGLPHDTLIDPLATQATAVMAGLYRAIKNISLISYQAVIAITFVIFPLVSRASFQVDAAATKTYVRQTFRTALLIVGLLTTGIAAGGEPLVILLFGEPYRAAYVALMPLLGAMAGFALVYVMANVLAAGGHPRDALVVTALTLVVQLVGLFFAIRHSEPGAPQLLAAGLVSLGSISLAFVASIVVTTRRFSTCLPGLSVLRVGAGFAAAYVVSSLIPLEGVVGIGARCAVAGIIYLAVLVGTREITRADLRFARGAPSVAKTPTTEER